MSPHPKLVAMRRRIARIRRTVAAVAVSAFIALFSTIYVQLATGNDPVLASTTTTTTTTTEATTTDSTESTESTDSTESTESTDSTDSTESTESTDSTDSTESTETEEEAAVTTAQS